MSLKKILFITNVPSPYRVKFFNTLSNNCDLTVIYEKLSAADRDEKWKEKSNCAYNEIYLNGKSVNDDSTISFKIKRHLKENKYDWIIFSNFATPTGIIGIDYCIRHKIKYCIEGDGAFYKKNFLKDIIKKRIVKHSSFCFSTCKNLDYYFMALGASKDKIIRYHFTSLTSNDLKNNSVYNPDLSLKKEMGIKTDKVFLYVGQFIKRKGVDILLKAFKNFDDRASLLLIGGVLTNEYSNIINENGLKNVFVKNFVRPSELYRYYKVSDVFVLPTREDIWGLVVNEALSYGIPTITTTRCNAGLEIINDDYNGKIIEPENEEELSKAMNKFLSATNMRDNCLQSIEDYSIEQMVEDHVQVFENERQ